MKNSFTSLFAKLNIDVKKFLCSLYEFYVRCAFWLVGHLIFNAKNSILKFKPCNS